MHNTRRISNNNRGGPYQTSGGMREALRACIHHKYMQYAPCFLSYRACSNDICVGSQNDKMMNHRQRFPIAFGGHSWKKMVRRDVLQSLQKPRSATPTRHLGVLPARPRRRRGVNRRAEHNITDIGDLKNRV